MTVLKGINGNSGTSLRFTAKEIGSKKVMYEMSVPLGHVFELNGNKYVDMFSNGNLERWQLGQIDSDGCRTSELQLRIPIPPGSLTENTGS